jgi:hypothetical protein
MVIRKNQVACQALGDRATPFSIQSTKRDLGNKILDLMGLQIMTGIQRPPQWIDSLDCTRENPACREEHRTL